MSEIFTRLIIIWETAKQDKWSELKRLGLSPIRETHRIGQSRSAASNRDSPGIKLRGSCARSRKHKCIADAGSIRRSAIACKTDTERGIDRDYPVICPGAGLCAWDSGNIGNCHFIWRRILREASVQLSFRAFLASCAIQLSRTRSEWQKGKREREWNECFVKGWGGAPPRVDEASAGRNVTTAFSSSARNDLHFATT